MIDSIIDALNESNINGFIFHKGAELSVIKAAKIIIYRLYYID